MNSKIFMFAILMYATIGSNLSRAFVAEDSPKIGRELTSAIQDGVSRILDNQLDKIQSFELENFLVNQEKGRSSVDLDSSGSCQLVKVVHLLQHPGCRSKAIASFACSGLCPSFVQTSSSKFWQRERSCSCCQHASLREATFTLDCPFLDPPYKMVKSYAPVDCLCRSCTDLGKENLQPQELVEALAGEGSIENDKL